MKRRKQYDDDDGRVIVPMDVDGMPGFFKRPQSPSEPGEGKQGEKLQLTREEERAVTGGALKAAFLVGAVFMAVFALFILFCQFVWFK